MAEITLVVPNKTHAFPINVQGTVITNSGSSTDIYVYVDQERALPVDFVTGPLQFSVSQESINISPPRLTKDEENKVFKMTHIEGSSIGDDLESVLNINSNNAADFKNIPAVMGQIVVTAKISDKQGNVHTKTETCTYVKARSIFTTETIFVEVDSTIRASFENVLDPEGVKSIVSFNWYADEEIIVGESDEIFIPRSEHVGKRISGILKYIDGRNNLKATITVRHVYVVNSAPINFPVIKGVLGPGDTLEADNSFIYDRNGTGNHFSYVWFREGIEIAETSKIITVPLDEDEIGKKYEVEVTYTDNGGSIEKLKSPPVYIRNTGAGNTVSIIGSPRLGQELIASLNVAGELTPTILEYEWRRDGIIIDNSDSPFYRVKRQDINKEITATIRYDTGAGIRYTTSSPVEYENSPSTGLPSISRLIDGGTILQDIQNKGSVGQLLLLDTSQISDGDDIKNYFYPLDSLQQEHLLRDKIQLNSLIEHNTIITRRSSTEQTFSETSDIISYDEPIEVQSIYLDNSLGNYGDLIRLQYKDENGDWQNAIEIQSKQAKYFLLEQNISSSEWRLAFDCVSTDNTANVYNFEVEWALESPSTLSSREFIYQWFKVVEEDGETINQPIVGARSDRYLVSQEDLNSLIGAKVTFIDGADQITSVEVDSSDFVYIENYEPTGDVSIEGVLEVGEVVTAKFTINDRDNISEENPDGEITSADSFQWYLDEVAIEGATSRTLNITEDMKTKRIDVEVFFTDAKNAQHKLKNTIHKIVNARPTGEVIIYGSPKVGKTLTISTTSLEDLNQFNNLNYQWFSVDNGIESPIEDSQTQNYIVKTTDLGKSIKALVYYRDLDGFAEELTTNIVQIVDSKATGEPSISGFITYGNTVTANVANLTDENGIAGYEYQWRIDSIDVAGATFQEFTIPNTGTYIDLAVTVIDTAQNKTKIYSEQKRIATAATNLSTEATTLQASDQSGNLLSIDFKSGSVEEETEINIYKIGTSEESETPEGAILSDSAWALTPHGLTFDEPVDIEFSVDENVNLILRAENEEDYNYEIVEGAIINDSTASISVSTFSVYVGAVFTPAVINGIPEQGNYLTASVNGDVTNVTFQWKRDGNSILNAQNSTYLLQEQDVGSLISVQANFTDINQVSVSKLSSEIEIINTDAQGQIEILGSRRTGVTLETNIISISDLNVIDSDYSYQWYRNGQPIEGATQSSYSVVEEDFLKDIFVEVSFTDRPGRVEKVNSESIRITKKGQISLTTNSRRQGDTLSIDTSELIDFYSIFNSEFKWYADGQQIENSSNRQKLLTLSESGKNIKASFVYVDGRGTQEVLETEERFIHTISDTITPQGGTISDNGITITIPEGAVSENKDILVYAVPYQQEQLPIGTRTTQTAYAFTPLDLAFEKPITITLPKPNEEYDTVLFGNDNNVTEFFRADDDYLEINNNKQITIQADNFGVFISALLYVRIDIVGTPQQGQTLNTLFTGEVFSRTYQWYRGELPIDGATESSYTVALEDVGEDLKIVSTYLFDENSSPEIVESQVVTIVNSDPVADTSSIIIGEDRVGETLTADPSGITDANNPDGIDTFLYQWKVEEQDISGQTNNTLTIAPEHFQKNITVEITYVDAAGLLESVTSDPFYISRIPPSGFVEIVGTPEVAETLEVDTDNLVDLNGIGEFSYQWKADGVELEGETGSTLFVTTIMENKAISVTLTYLDGVGELETVTSTNSPVIDAHPTGAVTIEYTILEVAQTLTANTSTIADANSPEGISSFIYQWKSNGVDIAGANSVNYVVANQFCNTNITVTVTFTDGDGYIESLTSEPVFIENSPVQGQPTVSGDPEVGSVLTINTDGLISDVNVVGTLNYKWFADDLEISGATEKTWTVLENSYVGKVITGQIYYVDGAGNNEQASTSNSVTIVNSLPSGLPAIEGTLQVGQTLTALTGAISDPNIIVQPFYFQWYVDGTAIQDATGSDYIVQVDDINKSITVDASYYDEGNTFETATSIGYTIINTPATGSVTITYTGLEQGDILSASHTIQDDNVRVSDYSYQWKRNGANILGANEPTYVLGHNDWNKNVTLTVSFTDTGGFVESIDSSNSISMDNSLPTGDIQLTGSDKVGEIVEIDVSQIQDKNYISNYEYLASRNVYVSYDINSRNYQHFHDINFSGTKDLIRIDVERYLGNLGDVFIRDENNNLINVETLGVISFDTYGFTGTINLNRPFKATGIRFGGHNSFYSPFYWRHNLTLRCYGIPTENTKVFNYQWYRDGNLLTGSTEKTYTTTFDDLYTTLTAEVSYTDLHGNLEVPSNSASFDIVNSPPEGTVLIAGTRNVGEELYFTHNVVDRDNVTVDNPTGLVTFSSYQWYQSDFEDGELTLINDATGSTLLLTPELQAKWIALDATYVDIEGDDDTIHASNRLPVKSSPTGDAIITSADLQLGRQAFIDTSTIADQNDLGEFSYQWYRTEGTGSIAISGAVQTHYSYQPEDLGENIYATVSYVDGDGDSEMLTSNTLGPVVQTSGSIGTVSVTDRVEIGGTIESDLDNILIMNNFETVAPVVAYNFHSDTRDVGSNQLHLAGTNYSFDEEGGLDLSHSTSAYLRTNGTTPVLNNDTHTIAFKVMLKGGTSTLWRKILSFGRTNHSDGSPEIWWDRNNKQLMIDYSAGGTTAFHTTDLESDVWYDIMFIKQGSAGRVYVDGTLVNEYTGAPNPKPTGDYLLEFGYKSSTHPAAPVIIKDFQIFDFAVDDYTSVTNYPFYTEPTLSLQWKADGNPIAGATGSVYQVPENNTELGKDITLEVSLTDALGNARTLESGVSTVVESDLVQVERFLLEDGSEMLQEDGSSFLSETTTENISLPLSINGDSSQTILSVDDIISVDVSNVVDPNGLAGVEYQWYADNTPLLNATGSSYLVTQEEINKDIRVKAVFEDETGRKSARLSDEILVVNTPATGSVTITSSGTFEVGNLLIANPTISDENGIVTQDFEYQWMMNGLDIQGEINKTYVLRNGDVGKQISVRTYFVDKGYTLETITSDAVTILNSSGTGEVQILGQSSVGSVLMADVSSISDPNGILEFIYQWKRDGAIIDGATSQSYTLVSADYNKNITVDVSYIDNSNIVLNIDARRTDSYNGTGNTVYDLSDYENNLSRNGNVSLVNEKGGLLYFDNGDDWLDGNLKNTAGDWEHTVEFVFRPLRNQSSHWDVDTIFHIGIEAESKSSAFQYKQNEFWWFFYANDIKIDENMFLQDQYYHVVVAYSGGGGNLVNKSVYINGIKKTNTYQSGGPNLLDLNANTSIRIGDRIANHANHDAYMYLAYLRVYNKGLSQDEAENLYMAQKDLYELPSISTTGTTNLTVPTNTASVYVDKAAPTGTVVIEGTREVLSTLTATNTIADLDVVGTLNYQWYRGGNPIAGATSSTFDVPRDYIGSELSVEVSYLDGNGDLETFISQEIEINSPPLGQVLIEREEQTLKAKWHDLEDNNGLFELSKDTGEVVGVHPENISGNIVEDSSGNNNTITLYNNIPVVNNGIFEAFDFNGSDQYIQISDSETVRVNTKTVSMWVKIDTVPNTYTVIATYANGGSSSNRIWLGIQNSRFQMHGWGASDPQSSTVITDGQWHHLVWSYDTTTQKMNMWIDGVREVSDFTNTEGGVTAQSGMSWYIGRMPSASSWTSGAAEWFDGKIANFKVYDRILTDEDVSREYNFVTSVSYQWYRQNSSGLYSSISDATSKYYELTNSDVEKNLKVQVTYTDTIGFTNSVDSKSIFVPNSSPTGDFHVVFDDLGPIESSNSFYSNSSMYDFTRLSTRDFKSGRDFDYHLDSMYYYDDIGAQFSHGGTDRISTATAAGTELLNNDYHTIAMRIMLRNNSNGTWYKIFTYGRTYGISGSPGMWWSNSGNYLHLYYHPGHTTNIHNIVVNQWYDVVIVKNGDIVTTYLNGIKYSEQSAPNPKSAGSSYFALGYDDDGTRSAPMNVQRMEVYPFAMTEKEVERMVLKDKVAASQDDLIPGRTLNLISNSIADVNGINGDVQTRYEIDGTVVSNSSTYKVETSDIGKEIKVVGTYVDSAGKIEQVVQSIGTVKEDRTYNDLKWNSLKQSRTYGSEQVITDPSPNYEDWFGISTAISGDGNVMVVGAHGDDTYATNAGSSYVFTKDENGQWTYVSRLYRNHYDGQTGLNVDINYDGSVIVVGAYAWDHYTTNTGAALIYKRTSDTQWDYFQQITASDYEAHDLFGRYVGISDDGDTIVIGAYCEDQGADCTGAVYIFKRNAGATTWSQQQKIIASNRGHHYYFGHSANISRDGKVIVVGAHGEDVTHDRTGAFYIFTEDENGVWTQRHRFYRETRSAEDIYAAHEVGMTQNGDVIAVGAQGSDVFGTNNGLVDIYLRNEKGEWDLHQTIRPPEEETMEGIDFGWMVRMTPDGSIMTIAAAGSGASAMDIPGTGAVYVYQRTGNTWSFVEKVVAKTWTTQDAGYSNGYGYAQDISNDGTELIIGSHRSRTRYGLVYTYKLGEQEDNTMPENLSEGSIISLDVSDISDVDGIDENTKSYKWYRIVGGNTILVSTNREYAIKPADFGHTLVAEYRYLDNNNEEEFITKSVYIPRPECSIFGLEVGNTLTKENLYNMDSSETIPFGYTVQMSWKVAGEVVSTDSSYTVSVDDLGKKLEAEMSILYNGQTTRKYVASGEVVFGERAILQSYRLADSQQISTTETTKEIQKHSGLSDYTNENYVLDIEEYNTSLLLTGENFKEYSNNLVVTTGTTSTVSTTEKKFGNSSYYFDGTNNSGFRVPNSDLFDLRNIDWTIEAWINPDGDYSDYRMIVGKRDNTSNVDYQLFLEYNTGELRFHSNGGSNGSINTGVAPTANQWNHVAIVGKGGVITIYLNGEAKASETRNVAYNRNYAIGIGNVGSLNVHPFKGYIDEVRIVKGTALYTENFTVPTSPTLSIGTNVSVQLTNNRDNTISLDDVSWYPLHGEKLLGTGPILTLTNDVTKYGALRYESVYQNYEGKQRKDSGTVELVSVDTTLLKQKAKQGQAFSLDLDNVILDGGLEITKVELDGGFHLPSWLTYNTSTKVLSGTPPVSKIRNLSIFVELSISQYELVPYDLKHGIIIELEILTSEESMFTTYQQFDWTGIQDPSSFVSQYGITSTRSWSGQVQLYSAADISFNKDSVFEEVFEEPTWSTLPEVAVDSEGYQIFFEEDKDIITDWNLEVFPSWQGRFQWQSRNYANFEQLAEKQFEENFDDLSWDGLTKIDWTDTQDPSATYELYSLNMITEFEEKFQWSTRTTAEFGKYSESLFEETFEDNTWTGFTRIEWENVENPSIVATTYGIQGYWEGSHDWTGNPQPSFESVNKLFEESYEDSSWTGFTRIDWNDLNETEKQAIINNYGISAYWEGLFKWSERAQPSFSDKLLAIKEEFEEDWTI